MSKDWGQTNVTTGSRTPWGPAKTATDLGPGITVVTCADGGGIKLSRQRNMSIPSGLRARSGWYEQDATSVIPGMFFPEDTRPQKALGSARDRDVDEWRDHCRHRVRDAFPDGYERATGIAVQPGESTVRDRSLWLARHKDDWLATSASILSDCMVVVTAHRYGEEKKFVVPAAEYDARAGNPERGAEGTFVVNSFRHQELGSTPMNALRRFHGIDLIGLTSVQRQRTIQELDTPWPSTGGPVRTVREAIEVDGITGKTVRLNGHDRVYLLISRFHDEDPGQTYPVSKTLWAAVEAPDARTRIDIAVQDADIAYLRWQAARGTPGASKAREVYKKLAFELDLLHRGRCADCGLPHT